MKRNIILLLILMCCWSINTSLYAQENSSTTLELLQSKNWIMWFPSKQDFSVVDKFSSNIWHSIFSYSGKDTDMKRIFFLSNSPDINDESGKRAALETGKYIITDEGRLKAVFEILKLTPDSLILKNLNNSSILTYFSKVEK